MEAEIEPKTLGYSGCPASGQIYLDIAIFARISAFYRAKPGKEHTSTFF
jgi:hypothetical protein